MLVKSCLLPVCLKNNCLVWFFSVKISNFYLFRCLVGIPSVNLIRMKYNILNGRAYHLVQLPHHFRSDQKLKHVIKGIVQVKGLGHLLLLKKTCSSVFKENLPNIESKPPLAQHGCKAMVQITGSQQAEISISLLSLPG